MSMYLKLYLQKEAPLYLLYCKFKSFGYIF